MRDKSPSDNGNKKRAVVMMKWQLVGLDGELMTSHWDNRAKVGAFPMKKARLTILASRGNLSYQQID